MICKKCGIEKNIDFFPVYKVKENKKYYRKMCIKCKSYEDYNKYHKPKSKSKKYITRQLYSTQVSNSKKRGHSAPNYSLSDLREWLYKQDVFHNIYNAWVDSGYNKWKSVSVDRIENDKPYTFENIQICTFYYNDRKAKNEIMNGDFITKCLVPIIQYDIDGNYLNKFKSVAIAARYLHLDASSIYNNISGLSNSAHGYIFKRDIYVDGGTI